MQHKNQAVVVQKGDETKKFAAGTRQNLHLEQSLPIFWLTGSFALNVWSFL